MSFRVYEGAWVRVEGIEQPVQVRRSRDNLAAFHVGDFVYDIDARPLPAQAGAPKLIALLDLKAVRDAGLPNGTSDRTQEPHI